MFSSQDKDTHGIITVVVVSPLKCSGVRYLRPGLIYIFNL